MNKKKRKLIKKQSKKKSIEKLYSLKESINNFSKCIPLYDIFNDKKIEETSSFYDMTIYKSNDNDKNNYTYDIDSYVIPKKIFKCTKISLKPNKEQTKILLSMLEGYRLIYNLSVSFIKNRYYLQKKEKKLNEINGIKVNKTNKKIETKINMTDEEKIIEKKKKRIEKINRVTMENNNELILDFKIIRTSFLKNDISRISDEYKTPVHILDKAVALACSSFKSAITNLKRSNIKNFTIRPIKKTKSSQIMDIEKSFFSKDGKSFIKSLLGNEVLNLNDFNYNEINNDCKIHYNKNTKKFILLVPEEIQIEEQIEKNNNYISIDPGLRTFLNCKTNNSYIEIGSNIRNKLKNEFEKLDNLETIKNNKKKKRYVNILKERMKNQITDTHWKIINYLTKTYKTILIGKWSTKSIISKKDSVLKKMDKRIVQKLSFYQFLDRLKYKCLVKNVNLKIVEEHYTSKVCTNCGNYNKDLTGEKIYNCKECKKEIKRDYNGARNIFIKSIKSIEI